MSSAPIGANANANANANVRFREVGGEREDANVQDLLRHVRNMGTKVERDLDNLRNLEKKFADVSEDDESLASQHFHIDVGGDDAASGSNTRKIIYYPREKIPDKPRAKDVSGVMARSALLDW